MLGFKEMHLTCAIQWRFSFLVPLGLKWTRSGVCLLSCLVSFASLLTCSWGRIKASKRVLFLLPNNWKWFEREMAASVVDSHYDFPFGWTGLAGFVFSRAGATNAVTLYITLHCVLWRALDHSSLAGLQSCSYASMFFPQVKTVVSLSNGVPWKLTHKERKCR